MYKKRCTKTYSFIIGFILLSFLNCAWCSIKLLTDIQNSALGGDGENVYIASRKGLLATHDGGEHWDLKEWHIDYPNQILKHQTPIPINPIRLVSYNQFILVEYYRDIRHHLALSTDGGNSFRDLADLDSDITGGFFITPDNEIVIGGYWCPIIANKSETHQVCVSSDLGKTWKTLEYDHLTNTILKVGDMIYLGEYVEETPNLVYADLSKPPHKSWDWNRLYKGINSSTLTSAGDGKTIYIASIFQNGLFVSEDNGIHWYNNLKLFDFVNGISHVFANHNDLYVSITDENILAISHDKGMTWQKVTIPLNNNFTVSSNIYASNKNIFVEMSVKDSADDSHLYLLSKDQGQHWSCIET